MTASAVSPPEVRGEPRGAGADGNGRGRANVGEVEQWSSIIGGSALLLYGLTRRSWPRVALSAMGGALVARGATGHSALYDALGVHTRHGRLGTGAGLTAFIPSSTQQVERSVTILKPRAEIYSFWRDFTNLPRFMMHLEQVTPSGDGRSHWVARAPGGRTAEWDAEITDDIQDERIAWRSTSGSMIANSGSVQFRDAPGDRGTVVTVRMLYDAPGGRVGAAIARLFGENPDQQVREDLRHLKQMMEAGETPTIIGQSRCSAQEGR